MIEIDKVPVNNDYGGTKKEKLFFCIIFISESKRPKQLRVLKNKERVFSLLDV